MNYNTKKMFSWILISFLTTLAITYVFVGNWFLTILTVTTSIMPEIFDFAFLEKKEIINISHSSRLLSEEIVQK